MAKSTSKKYYPYKRKVRWSSNITKVTAQENYSTDSVFYTGSDLCNNPAQSAATVSQIFTVKNVEIQFEINGDPAEKFNSIIVYIIYVPQGVAVTENYPNQHPEYIMAMKFLGQPSEIAVVNRNPLSVRTRLSRKLNTGDKIVFMAVGNHEGTNSDPLYINGICRFWTKAN